MQTIVELIDRDNVIVTHFQTNNNTDAETSAYDYARLILYHMRSDAIDVILSEIIDRILEARPGEEKIDLIRRAWDAINSLA